MIINQAMRRGSEAVSSMGQRVGTLIEEAAHAVNTGAYHIEKSKKSG
jgi:hypothetical protein